MLVDTHAHLCDPAFDEDRAAVVSRARRQGLGAIVAVAENLLDAQRNLEFGIRYPDLIRPAAGLFPTQLNMSEAEDLVDWIREHRDQLIAIGEVGLDLWKVQDVEDRQLQREIFSLFVDLSRELDLPLNVHSRAAGRQTIELLLERGATRVQLHAFDGRAAKAEPAVEAGYFFSVPPSVVRSIQKQKLVRRLPLTCLLVETDSPVLGVQPDDRNEPCNVVIPVQAIAELKDLPVPVVAAAVTDNAIRLYGSRLVAGHRAVESSLF